MKVVNDEFEFKVYCYCCLDCEERFYIEELIDASRFTVHCPICGSGDEVAVSSAHLGELLNKEE